MSNLTPTPRVNKLGHVVIRHMSPDAAPSAPKGTIPAPPAPQGAASFNVSEDSELGQMLAAAKGPDREYYRGFLEKGDIDGIRILHESRLEASSVVEIMDALNDIGVLDKHSTMDERLVKIQLHTPFHEAGLIDYNAYGADDEKNERLMRLVEDYAGHSVRVLELMMARDVQYAEELRPVLAEMDRNIPPARTKKV